MAIEDLRITEAELVEAGVKSLPDRVESQADLIKSKMDGTGTLVAERFNSLIEQIKGAVNRPYFYGVRFTDYVVTPSDISYQTFQFNSGTYRGFGEPVPGTYAPIVQEAGLYLVEFSVPATCATTGSVLRLYVDGGGKGAYVSNVAWSEASGQCFINVSTILALNVGDTISFRYSGTAGRTYTLALSSRNAYLSAIKLDEL